MKEQKKNGLLRWYALAAALVGVDQIVKEIIRSAMEVGDKAPFIPYVLEIFYVRNTGAAFSLFSGHTWVLAVISALASIVLAVMLSRRDWFQNNWCRLGLALLLGGAVGNLIDRMVFGAVTDMFNFTFMSFGIFNVADIGVTVGVILLIIGMFLREKPEKKEETDGADPADSAA